MSSDSCIWFEKHAARGPRSLRLFCIPHAGGSGYPYRSWMSRLPPFIELFGVRLPGRGPRAAEVAFHRMEPLLPPLTAAVAEHLDVPFALFGHSMGALIAFELCTQLGQRGFDAAHLFVSATRAPHFSRTEKQLHTLPRSVFLQELRQLNGTATQILEDEAMMSSFLPLLRADFELVETYPARVRPPVHCPLTALGGFSDTTVKEEQLQAWSQYTTRGFQRVMLPGDHFFINTQESAVLSLLSATFNAWQAGEAPR
jgi:medium-chain acyl-[acyl-carrier-protein] hydrolase